MPRYVGFYLTEQSPIWCFFNPFSILVYYGEHSAYMVVYDIFLPALLKTLCRNIRMFLV